MKKKYLAPLIEQAPTSWALIRASEAEVLQEAPFKRPILEIGCGNGLFSKVFFGEENSVDLGIDNNMNEISQAHLTGVYKQLIHCDATNLPIRDNSFKTIFSNGVLEHISQLPAVLQETRRILTKNGHLIFTCPSLHLTENLLGFALLKNIGLSSAATAYGNYFNRMFAHYNLYDQTQWGSVLQKHGLYLTSYKYYNPKLTTRIHELLLPLALSTKIKIRLFKAHGILKWVRKMLYLSWMIPMLLILPSSDPSDKYQSSIAVVAKKA